MKVSLITIVFNNKNYIGDCIQSVLAQTYGNVEHIVIDGASSDGTQQVIEPFKNQLACYISERDSGLYNALNKGIRKASGDVIGILHSDDLLYSSNTIQEIVGAFKTSGADMVYANGLFVNRDNIKEVKRIYAAKPFKKHYLYNGWVPLHTTIYVKKEVFQKYGYYDETYRIAGDYEISLRWLKNPEIRKFFLKNYVVIMRLGGKSTTPALQKIKSQEDYKIIKKYRLLGIYTLAMKITRKIPQFIKARIVSKKDKTI